MEFCKSNLVRVCLIFMAAIPAYCQGQRGTFGVDLGETSDKSGALSQINGALVGIDGHVIVYKSAPKSGGPDIVIGGEVRLPTDTQNHANEFALNGGPQFHIGKNFSLGFRVQVRKIIVPPTTLTGSPFIRSNMELLEIPLVVEYKFGPDKHYFINLQGQPEFTPRFKRSSPLEADLPKPDFNYGYTIQGNVGYVFGRWYAKGTYQTRSLKFAGGVGNPSGVYNWRTNQATAGFGLVF
jgi:hypothetical protein